MVDIRSADAAHLAGTTDPSNERYVAVVVGGAIPPQDVSALLDARVAAVFLTDTSLHDLVGRIAEVRGPRKVA